MRRRVVLFAVLAALIACDGGGRSLSRAVFSPEPGARPSGFQAARKSSPPLHLPVAARMFAGTDSTLGATLIYCERTRCERPDQEQRRTLVALRGGLVTFDVHRSPVEARLEIRTSGRGEPDVVALNPGTLMAYGVDLPPGKYLVTLVARWEQAEARWLFRLRVPAR